MIQRIGNIAVLLSAAVTITMSMPRASGAEGVEYPATTPGGHARDYFPAYNSGEDAMRAFWTKHGSPAALAQRPVEPRLDVWRQMREEHGALTPVRVKESAADFVEVVAHSAHGEDLAIRFVCEADATHGLVALRVQPADEGAGGPPPGPPPTPVADASPPPTDAQIVAALAAEVDSLARRGEFSGAVLLEKDGRSLFEHAYGMAPRATTTPNAIDTRFDLGSINKIFTHVAIEQLAQQGKLRLDDTIDRYLADYPKDGARKITIRMLLEHRGGVPDVLENDALWKDPARVRTMAAWYALVREMPLAFEPGTKQAYSNGGFVLLGQIVTKVSGEDYYDYIRKHVYAPAGMTRSDHYASDEAVEGRAIGYLGRPKPDAHDAADDGRQSNESQRLGRGSPAGGGYATIGDMARFARALRTGKLLDAAHVREMFGEKFSLGIAGGSPGVNGFFQVAGPYTFVVLANVDPPAAERFAQTTGRMVRRAAGISAPIRQVGGGH